MTTETRDATITLDEKLPTIRIERVFAAPPDLVFRAHADADLYLRWVGPGDLDGSEVDVWDCRTGGEWRYRSDHAGEQLWFRGCFHDVRPDQHLIVQTWTYEGWPDAVSLEKLVIEDLGDGRSRLIATSQLESFDARDGLVASGMEGGVQDGYRKLDRMLAAGEI